MRGAIDIALPKLGALRTIDECWLLLRPFLSL